MITRASLRWLLLSIIAVAALLLWLQPAIPQHPAYHAFADQRSLLGIANFANVTSNLGFLLAGWLGLRRGAPGGQHLAAWRTFHIGLLLTGIGSAGYHLAPDNWGLMWDRLGMAVAFTSLVALLLADRLDRCIGDRALWPLLVAGLAAVVYWYASESAGQGDLRPYLLVQLAPVLLAPPLLWWGREGQLARGPLWWMLGFYLLAKVAEVYDRELFALTGLLSGHSLKHLLGAAAGLALLWAARRRT